MKNKTPKEFYYDPWYKIDKMKGFFWGGMKEGYFLQDTWDMMLNSKQGRGILNEEYIYVIRQEGMPSFWEARAEHGHKYKPNNTKKYTTEQLRLLAEFIELITEKRNVKYEDLFIKMSVDKFMETCAIVLGNYDYRLYELYLK